MNEFAARVELHHATEAHYDALHKAMERAGYARSVIGSDGATYKLPTGMYVGKFAGNVTASAVRDHVRPIADAVKAPAWVFVTRYDQSAWWLATAKAAA